MEACGPVLGGQPSQPHRRWGSSPPRALLSSPGGPGARLAGKMIRGFSLVPSTVLVPLSSAGVLLLQDQPHTHLSSGALPSPLPIPALPSCRSLQTRSPKTGPCPKPAGQTGAPERGLAASPQSPAVSIPRHRPTETTSPQHLFPSHCQRNGFFLPFFIH